MQFHVPCVQLTGLERVQITDDIIGFLLLKPDTDWFK